MPLFSEPLDSQPYGVLVQGSDVVAELVGLLRELMCRYLSRCVGDSLFTCISDVRETLCEGHVVGDAQLLLSLLPILLRVFQFRRCIGSPAGAMLQDFLLLVGNLVFILYCLTLEKVARRIQLLCLTAHWAVSLPASCTDGSFAIRWSCQRHGIVFRQAISCT